MNSYTNNTKQLYIENIAVGLANVSNLYNLDMSLNEYLVVGQRNNINLTSNTLDTEYNFLINNNGVGINATRREMRNTNAGLYVNNNIICKGTITAKSVQFENLTLDSNLTTSKLNELITKVNSNLLFFEGYPYNDNKNVYTPSYLTIGNYASTYSNSHPLKVVDSPNGKAENIQLGIYNNINNDEEPARLAIGMLGFNQFTPANISTTEGMGLEFHISKSSKKIEDLYSNGLGIPEHSNIYNYPQMSIDLDGCININREKCPHQIIHSNQIRNPKLYVNGYAIISNIFTYDYYKNSNLHLDDIYIRKNGLTLDANQIKGGNFIKDIFTFNSNVNIGSNITNSYNFNVYGSGEFSQKITSESLKTCETTINGVAEFNKTTFFNNNVIFNDDLTINKSINVNNDLFIDGYRVNTSNLSFASNGLNFDYGSNLAISGRFGTGILNTDNYDNQFNIIKRKQERFELSLEDKSALTTDNSKVYIGHTKLNNLYGNLDNSLVFLTQKNIKWHNIYFYAGKDKDGCEGFKCLVPNLAIMENNRIGINTNIPMRTLDLIGDFVANDYYIRKNNQEYSVNIIYINSQKSSILNVKNLDINLENKEYLNKKTLNIIGGINSYDGYFENNLKITNFKDYGKISSVFNHIGIGITNTNNNYTIPLQIRNFSSNINNNSIVRIYRGIRGGGFNNNAFYSGIDFCDYDMPIKTQNRNNYKWFIYKNHRNEDNNTGTLQIGYTDNTYNPTHSCMNFFYNPVFKRYFIDINNPNVNYNYDFNNSVSIKGNVEIEGNLNLKGNSSYMINGIVVGNFSNQDVQSNILNNNITTNYTTDVNDLSLIGNKIGIFPNKTSIIAYKDEWIFNKLNNIQIDNSFKTPLFIYNNNDYYDEVLPPVITKFYNKSFKNFDTRPDIAIIELGILSDINDIGDINNKLQFKLKGNNGLTIFEISPNNNYPFLTCLNFDNKNQLNIGKADFYTSNHINFNDSCVNINDDFDYLLKLTNNQKPVRIGFENETNDWKFEINNNFVFNYNNQDLLILNENDINIPSVKVKSTKNNPSIECLNNYDISNDDDNSFTIDSYIKTPFSNLLITSNKYHFDYYDDNFDNNISAFSYIFNSNKYPIKDIRDNNIYNYHINNSNLIFNSNLIIDFTINLNNIELDYRYLESIPVYTDSNSIELIPSLRSYNPNLKAKIMNFSVIPVNYDIDGVNLTLNYKTPQTLNNELLISSKITYSNFTSNFENNLYSNINLLTFLNVKDKPSNDYKIKTITNEFKVNIDNFNYNYNVVNSIYYYPVPNINITDIQLDFSYNYNLRNEINVPSNFFDIYKNVCSIQGLDEKSVIINNSNSFLKNIIESDILYNYTDTSSFKKNIKISSNIVKKVYPIEINNMDITTLELTFTKNDYYEIYDYVNDNPDFYLPITINQFQPHLVLKNKINSQFSSQHKIFSFNDNYEIHLDDKKLISIDSNGSLNTDGNIDMKNVIFDGDIFYKNNGILTSITSNLTHIVGNNYHIQKDNISLNSSNIFLNPSIINNGGVIINGSDINSFNNLFQINNYNGNDNFITLKSVSNSGFINFWGINDLYKIGVQNGNFGIWRGISPIDNNLNLNQYTNERQYPPKLYDTSTTETTSSGEFLNVSPNIYYKQVITLNNNDISYGSGNYIIYSSSTSGTYYKINMFNNALNNEIGSFWLNGNYLSLSGNFHPSHFIKSDYLGDWLIIKLPKPIILTMYRFFSRNGFEYRSPSLFRFYGSTDGINFTEIIEASNDIIGLTINNYSSGIYEKKLNSSFNKLYTYIGFVVNKLVGGNNSTQYTFLNIAEFQIFGKEEINNSLFMIDTNNDININGNIKTTNNFAINDITTYKTNDYKLRVFGNMKVDGVVISSSDRRLKTNINKIENAMDKIERLSGVFFNKIGDDKRQLGLIAQDVNDVIEEAVYKDENGFLNIAYGNLMGLIIEGMKELRNEIKNLK